MTSEIEQAWGDLAAAEAELSLTLRHLDVDAAAFERAQNRLDELLDNPAQRKLNEIRERLRRPDMLDLYDCRYVSVSAIQDILDD